MSKYKITNSHGIAFTFGDTLVKAGVHEYDGLTPETVLNIQNAGHTVEALKGEPRFTETRNADGSISRSRVPDAEPAGDAGEVRTTAPVTQPLTGSVPVGPVNVTKSDAPAKPLPGPSEGASQKPGPVTR